MPQAPERRLEQALSEERHRRNMAKVERRRQLQGARKRLPPSERTTRRETRPGIDEDGQGSYERIMPRDASERRRAVERATFVAPAIADEDEEETPANSAFERGLVTDVMKGFCRVAAGNSILMCRVRGSLTARQSEFTNVVAVGDEVYISRGSAGAAVVEQVLPRRSMLARPDVFYHHLRQVIVANADQLLIVAAWRNPLIWLELIDRYLISAERTGLTPIICVNKVDLAEDIADCEPVLAPYRALGYRVLLTSASTGRGVDELRELLRGQLTVLAGLSGVGKSSLITAVQPGLQLRTGSVGKSNKKHAGEGRHTTTQATLHPLDMGGAVVDTPGVRGFGISGLHRHELAGCFPEIGALASNCRFANCTHLNEPDCAVLEGLATGAVAESRLHSYRLIFETLPA